MNWLVIFIDREAVKIGFKGIGFKLTYLKKGWQAGGYLDDVLGKSIRYGGVYVYRIPNIYNLAMFTSCSRISNQMVIGW